MPPAVAKSEYRSLLERDPRFQELIRAAEAPKLRLQVAGLNLPAAADCWRVLGEYRPQLILVSDHLRLRELRRALELAALPANLAEQTAVLEQGRRAPYLEARNLNLVQVETASREEAIRRMAILYAWLRGELPILLVPAVALGDRLPNPLRIFANSLEIRQGGEYDLEEIQAKLVSMGYERCRQVETAGQFARRGDILDIALYDVKSGGSSGLRLSFFDTELDQLRRFDLDNQRSIENLESAAIPPLRELLPTPEELAAWPQILASAGLAARQRALQEGAEPKAAERLLKLYNDEAERLAAGPDSPGLDRFRAVLQTDDVTILDYVRAGALRPFRGAEAVDDLVLLDEAPRFFQRLDAAEADFRAKLEQQWDRALIPDEAAHWRFDRIEQARQLDRIERLIGFVHLAGGATALPGSKTLQFEVAAAEHFRGREQQLFGYLQQLRKEHCTIRLVAGTEERAKRLRDLLNEQHLTLPIAVAGPDSGYVWPAAKVAIIGSQDIFGRERTQTRHKGKRALIDFSADLQRGDLVVHEIHGIARYDGLVQMETSNGKHDYLKLLYAEDDALYIPVEALDQIQRYIGGEQKKPKLTRLGGQDWERQKARARTSIRQLATGILELYAKRSQLKGQAMQSDSSWQEEFEASFPYVETEAQLRAWSEIKADQESDRVMDRLLCGDVGFGKTEIAFRAMVKTVLSGYQALMLVPTTVLARQHYESLKQRLGELPLRVKLLNRYTPASERTRILKDLAQGQLDILIGTHSLLSKGVDLAKPGLLVIDEEQRFGVDHKETLKERYPRVDVLTLSATPIPRTLHMSMSGIRDISVLEEGPSDRLPVQTYVLTYDESQINEAILREIARDGQVYYLFNDTRQLPSKANALQEQLPGARIIYAHGKMSEKRLDEAMDAFAEGEYDILVCTTIIESGIDLPNVNTVIVEEADRMGLAQLYQIRGRVGRSARQAYAYMTYRPEKVLNEDAEKRLAAIREYTALGSGFRIALRDLEVRGAGSLLGAEQHGHMEAIGYELYCRILDEEVTRLKALASGDEKTLEELLADGQPAGDCVLDLGLDTLLPPQYIPDEGERMDMYRRLATLRRAEDYDDILDEWLDRFGDPPIEALQLLDMAYVKARAHYLGAERVRRRDKDVVLQFNKIREKAMAEILALLQDEQYAGKLLFNAGSKPYLLAIGAATNISRCPAFLAKMFRTAELKLAALQG